MNTKRLRYRRVWINGKLVETFSLTTLCSFLILTDVLLFEAGRWRDVTLVVIGRHGYGVHAGTSCSGADRLTVIYSENSKA